MVDVNLITTAGVVQSDQHLVVYKVRVKYGTTVASFEKFKDK